MSEITALAELKQSVEVWLGDLDSGGNEPLLPTFDVLRHDISQDARLLRVPS
jgi:hypothetical protein